MGRLCRVEFLPIGGSLSTDLFYCVGIQIGKVIEKIVLKYAIVR